MFFIEKIVERQIEKKTREFDRAGVLRYFHYDFGSMAEGMHSFTMKDEGEYISLICQKNSMVDGSEDMTEYELPLTVMQEIKNIIKKERIYLWNGFSKDNSIIATGKSFNLRADFDNYTLKAHGMTMLPQGYEDKHAVISSFFQNLLNGAD